MGYEIIMRKYDDDGKMVQEDKLNDEGGLFDGAMIIGNRESSCAVKVEHMTIIDIAIAIASNGTILSAAMIAEAMDRVEEMASKKGDEGKAESENLRHHAVSR